MKQIFVLVPNPARAQLIRSLTGATGVHAHLSDGALPALTELERNHVDAVICDEQPGDMAGEDFRDILRIEPATRETPFFLLTDQGGGQATPPNFNLPPSVGTVELVRQVLEQLNAVPEDLPPFSRAPGDLHGRLSGNLLAELLTWVAESELSGHWLIDAGEHQGYLLMHAGDIVYAEYGPHTAHAAVLELLDAAGLDPESRFRFYQAPPLGLPAPRNIEERTERLLMEVTVALDHRHAERAGVPH